MKVYIFNDEGYFFQEYNCQKDPLESMKAGKDVYLIPANSTELKPLEEKEGYKVKFVDGAWEYEEIKEENPNPLPTERQLLEEELIRVKGKLKQLDYIGIKIATGRATAEEYAEEIQTMNKLAEQVNALEKQIEDLDD